jgi:hypothetical protein
MKRITPAAFLSEMKSMGWHPMTLNGSVFAYFTKDSFTFEDRGFFDAIVKRAHRCIRRGDLVRYLTEQGLVGALPLSAGPAYLMTLK